MNRDHSLARNKHRASDVVTQAVPLQPNKRSTHDKPIQYQRGWVEFYKLKFKVTPDVLIPRPETELLVDEVLTLNNNYLIDSRLRGNDKVTILDLGTGSGCIAIALAKYLPTWNVGTRIIAIDISEEALQVAKDNAKFHKVDKQISFVRADLLNPVTDKNLALHPRGANVGLISIPNLIVANLPYIPTARIPYLEESVKAFEPRIALDGGPDGFNLYRKLFRQLRHQVIQKSAGVKQSPPQGWTPRYLVCEIDYTHGESAPYEALKYFPKAEIEVKKDLAKKQRILTVKF